VWIFRDITERKRNENALRQLSQAVEQSPVSVVITDLRGNITYVNRRFTECTGYSFEEVSGRNPRILKSGYSSAADYVQMWDTIAQGGEWRGEFKNRKKNGELYWELAVISPIKDENGKCTHFVAVKEDITERKMMESHLRQAQKLEAVGQLAAGIAHEINTPIQFVGDNTQFLKEAWGSLSPTLALLQSILEPTTTEIVPSAFLEQLKSSFSAADPEYLQREIPNALDQSLEGLARVAKIVQAMKEFSHPGTDEKQFTDINKAILTTVTVARNAWKYVAELETILASDLALVPCHVGELNQVILNLIINSVHAIAEVAKEKPDSKGKITIRTTQDRDWTTISIQDTGSGIPVEIRSRIFEPFFTTKEVGKGTGQGLALAHNAIVQKHGGRLWFESEIGTGTTFYIQLPTETKV
jgi:PAS domain S-box-containing protein